MQHSEKQMIILDSVDSTNNYAMGLINNGLAADGISVFAHDQTAGRGRLGRRWISAPGANVHLSVITQMRGAFLHDQFLLSIAAALSVARLIQKYCASEVFVKWPNDIIINDRKAAGILIVNVVRGQLWQWAVTGIGLNVNQRSFENAKATSLFLETSEEFDPLLLAAALRESYLSFVACWRNGDHVEWLEEYNSRLFMRGKNVRMQTGNRIFETTLTEVNKEGKLITRDTLTREWDLDTVRILY